MLPVIQIGPLALQTPGLILLAGLWVGLNLAERYARFRAVAAHEVDGIVTLSLIAGIVGGRLGYALIYAKSFIADPFSLFSLNLGLFDFWSGLALALLGAGIYIQKKKLSFWAMADALTPLLGVIQIALSLANLASGEGYGMPTRLPWGITLWGSQRHPTQIYEMLAGLLILWASLPTGALGKSPLAGVTFLRFGALSAAARLFLEGFRGDSSLLPGGVRGEQILAWLALAIFLLALHRREQRNAPPSSLP